jgi:hypothetical protein
MTSRWFSLYVVALGAWACSEDAAERPFDTSSRADAGFTRLDGGSPRIDPGTPTGSPCEQADAVYSVALGTDAIITQLASCSVDTDCVLWSASITCASGAVGSHCPYATNAANVLQAEARRDVIAASTYCAPGAPVCQGGASCAPVAARCMQGTCSTLIAWPDAGL